MTNLYYGDSERKLIPQIRTDAIMKYEGKMLGQDFNNPGQKKVQLRIILQLDAQADGADRRFEKWLYFTPSLHQKSNLRKFLISWRGEDFTEGQLKSFKDHPFDLSRLVGSCCRVRVVHETTEEGKVRDTVSVIDQHSGPTFAVQWYADQREKFVQDDRDAEAYEQARRGNGKNGQPTVDDEDTTDYSGGTAGFPQ